jgi:hypothetical protein
MVLPETQRRRTGFCPNRRVAGRITRKITRVQAEMALFTALGKAGQIIAMPPFT